MRSEGFSENADTLLSILRRGSRNYLTAFVKESIKFYLYNILIIFFIISVYSLYFNSLLKISNITKLIGINVFIEKPHNTRFMNIRT